MKKMLRSTSVLLLVLFAISPAGLPSRADAAVASGTPATLPLSTAPAEHVVIGTDAPLALYRGAIVGLDATNPEARGEARLDPTSTASQAYLAYLDAQRTALVAAMTVALARPVSVTFAYSYAIFGLSTTLSPAEAATVAALPGVASVHRQEILEPLTDNGPKWMDADDVWSGTAGVAGTMGEGIVAGIIDTGINSDHPSFADPGPVDGFKYTNPRGRPFGLCAASGKCNNKLIGMYDFINGTSGEDDVGHGSHTASTVAGNVVDATLYAPTITIGPRRISGVAPHANVIMYKACFAGALPVLGGCPLNALIAAIDAATADVVDVINFSIGGGSTDPWQDPLGLSFYGSRAAGVFVAASAGNSGPNASTMGRPANSPWVLAVGASTHDRRPTGRVQLTGGASAHAEIVGMTEAAGIGPLPLVDAKAIGNELCDPFADTQKAAIAGMIVVCTQGVIGRVAKGQNVKDGGGSGMVLISQAGYKNSVVADGHVLPAVQIGEWDGASLRAWMASGTGHIATIVGTVLEESTALADRMAGFSSRGPDATSPNVIKPDVTAPGVAILAAFNAHAGPANTPEYAMIQGTSMSSPHAAGAGALVRAAHRDWTPDQVKSALMSTGFTTPDGGKETVAVTKEDHTTPADPFDRGGGRINVARAAKAGLTLDESVAAYQAANPAFAGAAGARGLNLASLANDDCRTTCSWTRTVASAAATSVTWTVTARPGAGFTLGASPATFTIGAGGLLPATQQLSMTATNTALTPGFWSFGEVVLTPSDASLPAQHFPVAVKARGAAPAQACFIPDTTVATDPSEINVLAPHNVREVGVSGLFPTFGGRDLPNITFRLKVDSLDTVPPDSYWRVQFIPPGAPANTSYYVQMTQGPAGEPTFSYGTLVPGTFTALGTPEAGSFKKDGTITMTIAASKVLNPGVGATLSGIIGSAGVAVPGTLTSGQDSSAAGTYTLGECQNADLSVTSGDIKVTGSKEDTQITATVHNTGKSDAPGVAVRFYVNGQQVGNDRIVDVPAGGTTTASVGWNTKGLKGDFVIRVVVDPNDAVPESDESNNSATKLVTVRGNRA
ncbi:MAG TPA: S8 family serine peptidase [Candidatus Limnocylindria bacterium]